MYVSHSELVSLHLSYPHLVQQLDRGEIKFVPARGSCTLALFSADAG